MVQLKSRKPWSAIQKSLLHRFESLIPQQSAGRAVIAKGARCGHARVKYRSASAPTVQRAFNDLAHVGKFLSLARQPIESAPPVPILLNVNDILFASIQRD
jgi:hypothetical protein